MPARKPTRHAATTKVPPRAPESATLIEAALCHVYQQINTGTMRASMGDLVRLLDARSKHRGADDEIRAYWTHDKEPT